MILNRKKNEQKIKEFEKQLNACAKEPCKITINNQGEKGTSIQLEGDIKAVFVTLAGAVRKILDETGMEDELFEMILEASHVGEHNE